MKIQSNLIFELFTFIKLFTFRLVSSLATKKNPSNSCKVAQNPFLFQQKKISSRVPLKLLKVATESNCQWRKNGEAQKLEKELGLCPIKGLKQVNQAFQEKCIILALNNHHMTAIDRFFLWHPKYPSSRQRIYPILTSIADIALFWRTQQRMHSLLNFFSLSKLLLLSS